MVRQKVLDIFFFVIPPLLFTKIFGPDRWAALTSSCSQLVHSCGDAIIICVTSKNCLLFSRSRVDNEDSNLSIIQEAHDFFFLKVENYKQKEAEARLAKSQQHHQHIPKNLSIMAGASGTAGGPGGPLHLPPHSSIAGVTSIGGVAGPGAHPGKKWITV